MEPDSAELNRILIIDSLATRYHLLPSEVLARADSVDIYIMDAALTYKKYKEDEEQHQAGNGPAPAGNIPPEKLAAMLEKVRSKNVSKDNKNGLKD